MFISIYTYNAKNPRVCNALLDTSCMHKEIQAMFDAPTNEYHVLHCLYDGCLLIKSDIAPIYDGIFNLVQTIDMSDKISSWKNGDCFNFMITTDPHKSGKDKNTGRHKIFYISDEKVRKDWVSNQLSKNGAEIVTIREVNKMNKVMKSKINKNTGSPVTFTTWTYKGRLKVTNIDKFIKLYSEGLGLKKAFGNGMLILS